MAVRRDHRYLEQRLSSVASTVEKDVAANLAHVEASIKTGIHEAEITMLPSTAVGVRFRLAHVSKWITVPLVMMALIGVAVDWPFMSKNILFFSGLFLTTVVLEIQTCVVDTRWVDVLSSLCTVMLILSIGLFVNLGMDAKSCMDVQDGSGKYDECVSLLGARLQGQIPASQITSACIRMRGVESTSTGMCLGVLGGSSGTFIMVLHWLVSIYFDILIGYIIVLSKRLLSLSTTRE